jgi:cytochrome c oxidase subunit II
MFERVQTALDWTDFGAASIGELVWAVMLGGTLVFAVIMVLAICGVVIAPRENARRRAGFGGGIAFPLALFTALLVYALIVSEAFSHDAPGDPLRIEVRGNHSWWDVHYPAEVSAGMLANEVRIPVGRTVELLLIARDAPHRLHIPQLGVDSRFAPGRPARLFLTARTPGVYGAADDVLPIIAAGPADFADWLARQRAPGVEPTDPGLVDGRNTFFRRECHACHTIRGTAAHGRSGPDLTHVGSRRSLGAATLDAHLRGDAGTQSARAERNHELRALAAYLASLR